MTRARLAAEAETGGPDGSSDQSVHSSGSDQFSSGRGGYHAAANEAMGRPQHCVQTNEHVRMEFYNQGGGSWMSHGRQQQQQPPPLPQMQPRNVHHYQYPRQPSPGFRASPYHFNGNMPAPAASPAFGVRSQGGDTWDTASAASEYSLHATYSSSLGDTNNMHGNRGRCFSAGATTGIPYPLEKNQQPYYGVHSAGAVNRQECSSMTPPGMSRLHEDRPLFFSNDEKSKLAIPPLSEPRMRFHSTGGLNGQESVIHASSSSLSPPPEYVAGNAFVPITKMNDQSWSQLMDTRIVGRNGSEDSRALLAGSATSGNGDLPSSMAEAVLASITSRAPGAPIGGQLIGPPRFRTMSDHEVGGESTQLSGVSLASGSVFRMGDNIILPEASGSRTSLFSGGESRDIFSPKVLLETHSWGGGSEDGTVHSTLGLSHDFSNLWNLPIDNGPALRGRAATEPVWFGGNDSLLVSRIDPEVEANNTFVNMNPQNHQGGL